MVTSHQFRMDDPLPRGTTVLEASAGTGKTFTIAALAARFVAEGRCDLSQILLITFGRSATRELRERVRLRFLTVHRALADPASARASDDPVVALIVAGDPQQISRRRDRVAAAMRQFDRAMIATTHQFCEHSLRALGLVADRDPGEVFADDLTELVTSVAEDLWAAEWCATGAPIPFSGLRYEDARTLALDTMRQPQAEIITGPRDTERASARIRFAREVRSEVYARRRRGHLYTYDDQVERLAQALSDPVTGEFARQRLRGRFQVVMVDEFQDTDPLQWQILHDAFHGNRDLVLIGDPKQAIYAFRGGDVESYLAAAGTADQQATLTENWRSPPALVAALGRLFGAVSLGSPLIRVAPLSSRAIHNTVSLPPDGDPVLAQPLRLRYVPLDPGNGPPTVGPQRELVTRDLAAEIVRTLNSGTAVTIGAETRTVTPGDIAVLVRDNRSVGAVHRALLRAGVPAVIAGSGSVFQQQAARDWLTLLRAIEQPGRAALVRAALITRIMGCAGVDLIAGDATVDRTGLRFRDWAEVLARSGVAALFALISDEQQLLTRLLAEDGGERYITDLRHVAEALHGHARHGEGTIGLTDWLAKRIAEAGTRGADENTRRLDQDAEAVQVLTLHACKGREYPIVFLPFAWSRWIPGRHAKQAGVPLFHQGGRRWIDVRGPGAAGFGDSYDQARVEDAGEDLRLHYVGLTRAQCQLVMWWAPTKHNTSASAVHRLLAARVSGDADPAPSYPLEAVDPAALQRLLGFQLEPVPTAVADPVWHPDLPAGPPLQLAPYTRTVDTTWRRTSYSGITRAIHDAHYGPQEESAGDTVDEPALTDGPTVVTAPDALVSPMVMFPAGTTFGTIAHQVYEEFDASAPDRDAELLRCCERALLHRSLSDLTPASLATGLRPSFETRMGPLAADLSLGEIMPADRLAELDFEYPMAGGDEPGPAVFLRVIADGLRRHLAPDDPLAGYADRLEASGLSGQELRGFLSGSIDAVLRVPAARGGSRFLVCDYKTNWLGGSVRERILTSADYHAGALAAAMADAHYPLQALLYSVALHRYLRWRLPGYEPSQHLGGILYLFVRGMCGPDTPVVAGTPTGVFSWRPPAVLIEELSDALAGLP